MLRNVNDRTHVAIRVPALVIYFGGILFFSNLNGKRRSMKTHRYGKWHGIKCVKHPVKKNSMPKKIKNKVILLKIKKLFIGYRNRIGLNYSFIL